MRRGLFAPVPEGFEHVVLATRDLTHCTHLPEAASVRLALGRVSAGQCGKGILRFFPAAAPLELIDQPFTQRQQRVRVHLGIGDLSRGQRALPPVGALHPLVADNAKLLFQNRCQPNLFPAQNPGRQLGVKDTLEKEAVAAVQCEHVVVRCVHDHFHRRVSQQLAQRRKIAQPQRIHQIIFDDETLWRAVCGSPGNLNQTDGPLVAVQTVALRVERKTRLAAQLVDQPAQGLRGVNQRLCCF